MVDVSSDYIDFLPNLNKAQPNDGASRPMIAAGDYEFEITGVTLGQTKGGDKMMLTVDFECATEGTEKGKQCRGWYVLDNENQFNMDRLMALLVAAGVQIDANGGFSKNSLVGAHIIGTIEQSTYTPAGTTEAKPSTRLNRERTVAAQAKAVVPPAQRKPQANGGVQRPAGR